MPRAAARENEQLAARASSEAPMALFQHLACEFPLLRDAYWSSGASSTPASSPFRHSNRSTPAQGASTPAAQRLSWAAAAADAALEQRSVSPNKRHSGIGSVSVDLGSALRGRGSGATQGDDVMPPVPELQRSESVADSVPRARFGLRSLDLQALPRDDAGPPSELGQRRQKFAQFEGHCSEVAPGLCVGGGAVARSRETLRTAGVTHVVNCVGMLIPACFAPEIDYLTLFLQDTPGEDLTSVLYTVFDYIEAAREGGGCVLVHCSQGVSRSAALVIGYLMWKLGQPYDEVYQAVKAIRGVANPNIGFTCQLLQWQKRRAAPGPPSPRMLRVAPASPDTPQLLVPRAVAGPVDGKSLDPRGVFVVALPQHTYVWKGSEATPELVAGGAAAAAALHKYEGAPVAHHVAQGLEPQPLLQALHLGGTSPSPCHRSDLDADFKVMQNPSGPGQQHSGARPQPQSLPQLQRQSSQHAQQRSQEQQASDQQQPLQERQTIVERSRQRPGLKLPPISMKPGSSTSLSATASSGGPDSSRASKTPRSASRSGSSPNSRARKSARSQLQPPLSPGRPLGGSSGSSSDSDSDVLSDTD